MAGLLNKWYPRRCLKSAYAVEYEKYYEKGYRGIIFDIDNTLVPHGAPADQRALELFDRLRKLGVSTCLLSNNKEPRVSSFAKQVKSLYIYKGRKPAAANYGRAMELMGTDTGNTLFVGDQVFTDIYGANRCGIYSILVRPIDPKEEIQIVVKRRFEAIVLYFYLKQKQKSANSKGEKKHDSQR